MKYKNIITTAIFALVLFSVSLSCWLKPDSEYSKGDRRYLTQKPEFSVESLTSGEYMKNFSAYVVDQFPLREQFRSVKTVFSTYALNKKDNNGLYTANGHISKIEYPLNDKMIDNAYEKFDMMYNKFMKDKHVNVYLSIIPDKNYFLAEPNGYLSIDYDNMIDSFKQRLDYMKYIDIIPLLESDDYYNTDSHWKQEKIYDVAQHIAGSMGTDANAVYDVNVLEKPFEGVYLGQSALPFKPDTIKYLTNDILTECDINYYDDTGKVFKGDIYNMEKANGKDPYELFLSGTQALIEINNPNADTDKQLVVFRDSYGSSLIPLLVPGYSKITIVDIRYIVSDFVGAFVKFNNQDVLFMYSTTLLNNSMSLK